jgi:hypothetical protein
VRPVTIARKPLTARPAKSIPLRIWGHRTDSRFDWNRQPLGADRGGPDGAANLFIADFNDTDVIEVPTSTGLAPSVLNTGCSKRWRTRTSEFSAI